MIFKTNLNKDDLEIIINNSKHILSVRHQKKEEFIWSTKKITTQYKQLEDNDSVVIIKSFEPNGKVAYAFLTDPYIKRTRNFCEIVGDRPLLFVDGGFYNNSNSIHLNLYNVDVYLLGENEKLLFELNIEN